MGRSYPEELRSMAEAYAEHRLLAEENIRRMRECSKKLFKEFLRYVEARRSEGVEFQQLVQDFLTEQLGLEGGKYRSMRISLARRFYALAAERSRSQGEQARLAQYFEKQQ